MKYLILLLFPLLCYAQSIPNIYIDQVGSYNTVNITQDANTEFAKITAGSVSDTDNNSYTINQQGYGNMVAGIDLQSGINNTFNIQQNGAGTYTALINGLNGSANSITVSQYGSATSTFHLETGANTINNADTINVTQGGNVGADKSFNLTLNGSSGATVTIVQDNPTVSNSGSMTISCLICGSYSYIRH